MRWAAPKSVGKLLWQWICMYQVPGKLAALTSSSGTTFSGIAWGQTRKARDLFDTFQILRF